MPRLDRGRAALPLCHGRPVQRPASDRLSALRGTHAQVSVKDIRPPGRPVPDLPLLLARRRRTPEDANPPPRQLANRTPGDSKRIEMKARLALALEVRKERPPNWPPRGAASPAFRRSRRIPCWPSPAGPRPGQGMERCAERYRGDRRRDRAHPRRSATAILNLRTCPGGDPPALDRGGGRRHNPGHRRGGVVALEMSGHQAARPAYFTSISTCAYSRLPLLSITVRKTL